MDLEQFSIYEDSVFEDFICNFQIAVNIYHFRNGFGDGFINGNGPSSDRSLYYW